MPKRLWMLKVLCGLVMAWPGGAARAGEDADRERTLLLEGGLTDEAFAERLGARDDWRKIVCRVPVKPAWLEMFARYDTLAEVQLHARPSGAYQLSGEALAVLARCPSLRRLQVIMVDIPDPDTLVNALAEQCPDLESLVLASANSRVSREAVMRLAACRRLRSLELQLGEAVDDELLLALTDGRDDWEALSLISPPGDGAFTRRGLASVARSSTLNRLWLSYAKSELDDASLVLLAERCPKLASLGLGGGGDRAVTDAGFAALAGLADLAVLILTDVDGVTDDGLAAFRDHGKLQQLALGTANITDAGLAHLATCGKLWFISLPGSEITDAGLAHLAALPRLNNLNLPRAAAVTQAGIDALRAKVPTLQWISTPLDRRPQSAARPPQTDPKLVLKIPKECDAEGLAALVGGRTDWEEINCEAPATDAWIETFVGFPNLKRITLAPRVQPWLAGVSSAGIARLAACTRLRYIHIPGFNAMPGDEVLTALARGCPELEFLVLWAGRETTNVTLDGLKALAEGCPKLATLQLNVRADVGDDAVMAFVDSRDDMREFILAGAKAVTDQGLAALAKFTGLRRISLGLREGGDAGVLAVARACRELNQFNLQPAPGVTDAALAALAGHPALDSLGWSDAPLLTDAGLAALKDVPLRFVSLLGSPGITDAGVIALVENTPVVELTFSQEAALTDAALKVIGATGRMRRLYLPGNDAITDEGLLALTECEGLYYVMFTAPGGITAAGQAAFREQLPKTRLQVGQTYFQSDETGPHTLNIPEECDDASFAKLVGDRTDWKAVVCRAAATDAWMEVIARFPDLERIQIQHYGRNGLTGLTSAGLARLGACSRLKNINIGRLRAPLGEEAVLALAKGCPELEHLSIWDGQQGSAISTEGLKALAVGCPGLRSLQLSVRPDVGDDALSAFADSRADMTTLSLYGAKAATDRGLSALAKFAALHVLDVGLREGGDAGVTALAQNCRNLSSLTLRPAPDLGDDGLAALAGHPALSYIVLDGASRITDAGLASLKDIGQLRGLTLSGSPAVTDAGVIALAENPSLQSLHLSREATVTDAALKALGGRKRLQTLSVPGNAAITDAGLLALAECVDFRQLNVMGPSAITAKGRAAFRKHHPNAMIQLDNVYYHAGNDSPTALTIPKDCDDDGFAALVDGRTDWTAVDCHAPATDAWMEVIAGFPGLERFTFQSYFTAQGDKRATVTSAGIARLGACPKLRYVHASHLDGSPGRDAVLALAKGCPGLESLMLWGNEGSDIDTDALKALAAACPKLKSLQLNVQADVGDDAILAFTESRDDMSQLIFAGAGDLTDKGLSAMAKFKGMNRLWVRLREGGDAGLKALADHGVPLDQALIQSAPELTDAGLAALGKIKTLRHVSVSNAPAITEAGVLAFLADITPADLTLPNETNLTDATLKALGAKANLRSLTLPGSDKITDEGLLALAGNAGLQYVHFMGPCGITADGEAAFRQRLPNARLSIQNNIVTHHGGRPRDAKTLVVPHNADEAQFKRLLAGRTDWTRVECWSPQMTDAWAEAIAALPGLVAFNNAGVNPAGLSSDGMAMFARGTKLKELAICSQQALSDEGFAAVLAANPGLETVNLCDTGAVLVGEKSMAALAGLENLRALSIRALQPGFGEALMAALGGRTANLTVFEVQERLDLTPESVRAIVHFPKLERLALNVAPGAGDGLAMMLGNHCPDLRSLTLGGVDLDDKDFVYLGALERLDHLFLPDTTRVTDAGLAHLAPLQQLVVLYLHKAVNFTDEGFRHMAKLRRLRDIRFDVLDGITDEAFVALGTLPNLHWVGMSGASGITDKGVTALAKARTLSGLALGRSPAITDEGVKAIAQYNPNLVNLWIGAATDLTDASLEALDRCGNLRNVGVQSATGMTAAGIERFRKRHPRTTFSPPAPKEGEAADEMEEEFF